MNLKRKFSKFLKILLCTTLAGWLAISALQPVRAATQFDILGPTGSRYFGETVTVLANGNIVVPDHEFSLDGKYQVGAVHLYNGASGELISSLTGATDYDQVGSGEVISLSNGNFLVTSPLWDNGLGSLNGDRVGVGGVFPLSNGNFVVSSPRWDNGSAQDAGAVTWRSGFMPSPAVVSSTNSLVGGKTDDQIGYVWYENSGVIALSNGNYLVSSPEWDNGAVINAGAVTWGSGTLGVKGSVSAANSLVGSSEDDQVGYGWEDNPGVTLLSNGNYVVSSLYWNYGSVVDTGAVTWGNGASGVTGAISIANSLVGSSTDDQVGWSWNDGKPGITPLDSGNYLIYSPFWSNGVLVDAGAVTWGSGTSGVSGSITSANSVRGMTFYNGVYMNFQYDPVNNQVVVGRLYEDIVTLFNLGHLQSTFLPMITK